MKLESHPSGKDIYQPAVWQAALRQGGLESRFYRETLEL